MALLCRCKHQPAHLSSSLIYLRRLPMPSSMRFNAVTGGPLPDSATAISAVVLKIDKLAARRPSQLSWLTSSYPREIPSAGARPASVERHGAAHLPPVQSNSKNSTLLFRGASGLCCVDPRGCGTECSHPSQQRVRGHAATILVGTADSGSICLLRTPRNPARRTSRRTRRNTV